MSIDRENSCAKVTSSSAAQAEAARAWIEGLLSKHRDAAAAETETSVACGRHLGAVMGKGGVIVRQLQDETGARIDADRATQSVKIVGTAEQCAAAAERVRAIVSRREGARRAARVSARSRERRRRRRSSLLSLSCARAAITRDALRDVRPSSVPGAASCARLAPPLLLSRRERRAR